ncbi:MAG: protein jag [Clostridiales bacterium]|nr:protein jag [Clostridiales bacterium]MCF8021507.1 protein jag [Clostridiales bacterium]
MKEVEKTSKNIEQAIKNALDELGASKEDVEIDVLEKPSKYFLGLFTKPGKVKVKLIEKPVYKAKKLLSQIFDNMNLDVIMDAEEFEQGIYIRIEGKDLGILIGRRGETLDSLQYIVNLSINKDCEDKQKIILDVEGYRKRREETLKALAVKLANKAKNKNRNVILEPMNSQERRIIHTKLQSRNDVHTYSEGEEPYRKVIISPR